MRSERFRMMSVVAATALLFGALATACAVIPSYPASSTTFEGFPVISHIPDDPEGVVFVFHGSGGSADAATKLETTDMLNHLVARGYGFVATESTDRANKQWNNVSLSLTANADLGRLVRLHADLVSTTELTTQDPIYAIGMSQGAGFASVFAQAFENAGYPVAAIAPSHGPIPAVVRNSGGLTVPAFFALGANDTTVNNIAIVGQVLQVAAQGVPTELFIEAESILQPVRLMRVPGVDGPTADAVFGAAVAAGLYDTGGNRLVSIDTVVAVAPTLPVPSSLTLDQKRMILEEVRVALAVHVYSATYATQTANFFDANRA